MQSGRAARTLIDVPAPARRRLYQNRGTHLAVATIGSHRLDATPGLVPASPANDTEPPVEVPELKWINVANQGEYLGHSQGEFSLTPQVLQQLVDNFHASPKFKLGQVKIDGQTRELGVGRVVQYDYEHASEMAPWEGTIPTTGAPAIGWVHDLELRKGAGGRLQLWALSWLGKQIRKQIAAGEYDSVSIAWNPNGKHWVTGEPIGAVLTSVAFTNHPFLQDLESLAARELRLSRRASAAGGPRSGAAGQPSSRSVQPRARTVEAPSVGSSPSERPSMKPENRALLCRHYGLIEQADDAVIIRAAENASTSGGKLSAVLAALGMADAEAALKAIPGIMGAMAELDAIRSELASILQGDAAADAGVADADVAAAMSARGLVNPQGQVDAILFGAFKAAREAAVQTEIGKLAKGAKVGEHRAARERGRQAFLAACGVDTNTDPRTAHLTRTLTSGPGVAGPSTQYANPQLLPVGASPLPGAPPGPQPIQLRAPGAQPGPVAGIDWTAYHGNWTQRIMGYLASQDSTFSELDIGTRIQRASAWRKANAHLMPAEAA